jgi:pyridoxal phosphate enzyme (YggS family)
MSTLEERIEFVRDRIERACQEAGRPAGDVELIAVSKTVDETVVRQAIGLGLSHFGENRVQDATVKFSGLGDPNIRLHLIGQLQSNKARAAARVAHLIESVDRLSLVEALERDAARLASSSELAAGPRLPVLLQVNVAREEQKSGCAPEDAAAIVEAILAAPTLELRGLMTIAPLVPVSEEARPTFVALRELRDDLSSRYPQATLSTLSMGMTNDFEVAIEEGSTSVRVGRAIFAG